MAKKFISATYKSKKITLHETVNLCTKEAIFRELCAAEHNGTLCYKVAGKKSISFPKVKVA